jgi:hypothetical protein
LLHVYIYLGLQNWFVPASFYWNACTKPGKSEAMLLCARVSILSVFLRFCCWDIGAVLTVFYFLYFFLNCILLSRQKQTYVTRSLVLCVCFEDRCLSFCTFSCGHCVVRSSSIYELWELTIICLNVFFGRYWLSN